MREESARRGADPMIAAPTDRQTPGRYGRASTVLGPESPGGAKAQYSSTTPREFADPSPRTVGNHRPCSFTLTISATGCPRERGSHEHLWKVSRKLAVARCNNAHGQGCPSRKHGKSVIEAIQLFERGRIVERWTSGDHCALRDTSAQCERSREAYCPPSDQPMTQISSSSR